jgi:K+-transporting ATPase ATPase C chain
MSMLRLILVMTILCGVIYPLGMTLVGQTIFKDQANGSLITQNGKIIGSKLLAQKFAAPEFFHPRPSSSDYVGVGSGATNLGPISENGKKIRLERQAQLPEEAADAWTASGSGLDPHISPETAFGQLKRVAAARGMNPEELKVLVTKYIQGPTLGIWGQPRVNVLELNIALIAQGNNEHTRSDSSKP